MLFKLYCSDISKLINYIISTVIVYQILTEITKKIKILIKRLLDSDIIISNGKYGRIQR